MPYRLCNRATNLEDLRDGNLERVKRLVGMHKRCRFPDAVARMVSDRQ
jgi:hypothetical protein